jgi:phospholipase/carboxylesterase
MKTSALSLVHLIRPPKKAAPLPPLILLLHGVGSHERDLFDLAQYLDPRAFIVSARAPNVLGPNSYAWYPVEFTAAGPIIDAEAAEDSRLILLRFIDELIEAYRVDPKRIYLMGFSQGAIMSLMVALTQPEKVAGVVAMSGRLLPEIQLHPQPLSYREQQSIGEGLGVRQAERLHGLPILMTHGLLDPIIPIEDARAASVYLSRLPVLLTYREYDMGHQVTVESLKDIVAWLKERLTIDN